MEEKPRLIVSLVLAVLLHVSFLLKADNSVTTVASSQIESMQFNLITLIQSEPVIAKQENVLEAVKSKSLSTVNKIKQLPIKKRLNPALTKRTKIDVDQQSAIKKAADSIIAETDINRIVEKTTPLIQRSAKDANISSVTREDHVNFLQQPKFNSLPPAPVYPRQARLRGQQGTTIIHARLNEQGEVINTFLAKSSGFTLLDSAALKAVQNWDFLPGDDVNGAAQVWVEIPVHFIINSREVS